MVVRVLNVFSVAGERGTRQGAPWGSIQATLSVQDAHAEIKPSGGGVDPNIESTHAQTQQFIIHTGAGVDARVEGGRDAQGSGEVHDRFGC